MVTTPETLDVAWILICAALVMLMQAGFACLESGSVRSKNSINVAAKNFADFCISSAIFWLFGFALMFGVSSGGLFGTSKFFFDDTANPWLMAFFIFQLGFCGTAVTIVSGAVAERMRFVGYLVITVIMSGLIYPVVGHWVWGSAAGASSGGWLEAMGFIDFAGCAVVHSVGGWVSLAAIIIIGPRIGRFGKNSVPIHGHDIPIVTLGAFILWFGWFGFNGGSTLGLTPEVPTIIVNTTVSGAFGGVVALMLAWWLSGRADVLMIMNGSLAGLVGITASAHIMTPLSAMGIGCIAGAIMYGVTMLLERLELDDVVGAVPVHLGAGIWGLLAVALFGDPETWGTGLGRWEQLVVQATGAGATFAWAFGVGFTLLWLYNRRYPLRIDPEGERIGLNVAEHDASTEILDLLTDMDRQRKANDFSQPVNVEPHTEIGQIAQQYNRVLADINTEQRQREAVTEALRERSESLKLLRRVAAAANKARTVDEAMQTCLEDICEFGRWPVGHVYLLDEQGSGELVPTEIWCLEDPERFKPFKELTVSTRFAPGVGLPGRVLASREPHWIADLADDTKGPRYAVARAVGIKGGLAVPVLVGNDVTAVLEFFSTEVIEPDSAILEILSSLGTQLGRVVERKRSEAARFKSVIDNMPAMIHVRDLDGRFVLVNRKYEEFYGVTNDFVRGKTLHEADSQQPSALLAPERNVIQDKDVLTTGQVIERESTYTREGEERAIVDVRFPVTELSGETVAVAGIELDITERKRAEEKLEEAYEIIREQKERMESELNIGREIQMSMLPVIFPPFPSHDEFSIYAQLEPAREVGGDFYDFYFIDDERLCLCVGDVSGKGVPAALFMAVTKTLIKSRTTDDFSTASILTHVNAELSSNNESCMFVTIFLGILNIRTGLLTYTNAGHNPTYLKRRDNSLRRLDALHGPVVGAMSGMVYGEASTTLDPEDLLFAYTDGVTEEMNADNQLFSEKRMAEVLRSKTADSAESAVRDMISAVRSFKGETEQSDDITILAMQFLANPAIDSTAVLQMSVKNDLSEIATINATFGEFAKEHNLPTKIRRRMSVAFDDLLNNVISYAFQDEDEHEVEIRAELTGDRLTVTISDDGIPFNPLGITVPDTSASLEEREVGGLGIHLVRNMADDISYQRRIDRNVLSVVMHVG
jgi:Amt family ammonium transporter